MVVCNGLVEMRVLCVDFALVGRMGGLCEQGLTICKVYWGLCWMNSWVWTGNSVWHCGK